MKQIITKFGALVDLLQILAAIIFAGIGPFFWMYWLWTGHRYLRLTIVAIFWILSLGIVILEMRRKGFTAVSLDVYLAWLVALAFVFSSHYP